MKSLFALFVAIFIIPCSIIYSQEIEKSKIDLMWHADLSWQQIKKKAKAENKYIFVDCYATWCLPCKKMDREIYSNDSITRFLGSRFISLKIQMDTSKSDNEEIKKWYSDANYINKEYHIRSYPTFLFFSPDGELVHRDAGFKNVKELLDLASSAVSPEKQYYTLLNKYKNGAKNYSQMVYLANTTYFIGDKKMARVIAQDYIDNYLSGLKKNDLITKENIKFLISYTTTSSDKSFWILFKNADKINRIMHDSGYVQAKLHYIISMEEIQPALDSASKSTNAKPDWSKLSQSLKKKYNNYYAERAITEAKIRWYQFKKDWAGFSKYTISFVNDFVLYSNDDELTDRSWDIFLFSSDKGELQKALEWTKRVIARNSDSTNILPNIMDTYANLIYKMGYLFNNKNDTSKAIEEEQKALDIAVRLKDENKIKTFKGAIDKMKNSAPTWIVPNEKY
jgi:thioredoxin-related protein